jgi:hypothetical protein
MPWSFSTATKNARANSINTYAGAGAKLQVWSTGYGTKLAEWAWTGSVFAAASSGAVAMNAPTTNPVTPLANGTAAIGRLVQADGTTIVLQDLTVGTSGTDIIVTNASFVTTAPETLLSFGITEA